MECPICNEPTLELSLMAGNSKADNEDSNNKNHLVTSCRLDCPDTRTKVRILRRAGVPIVVGQPSPMLEVEVIGKMLIRENVFEGNHRFELFAVDIKGNSFKTVKHRPADAADGSWDMEVDGNRGHIKGFEGHWERADWGDEIYEYYGLSGVDRHCAKLEGWPPVEWFNNDDEKEEEVSQGVEAGEPENLVQVINDGGDQGIDGHAEDEDNQGYDVSDTESAA